MKQNFKLFVPLICNCKMIINFKFIFDYSDLNISPELSEYLNAGEVIIRPDKKIYGVSSTELDINKLVSQLLMQIE